MVQCLRVSVLLVLRAALPRWTSLTVRSVQRACVRCLLAIAVRKRDSSLRVGDLGLLHSARLRPGLEALHRRLGEEESGHLGLAIFLVLGGVDGRTCCLAFVLNRGK